MLVSNLKLSSIALLVFAASSSVDAQAGCRERREWRQLSSSDKLAFHTAVKALKARPISGQTASSGSASYDDFIQLHWDHRWVGDAHNGPKFFPFHRMMMLEFENALRTVNSAITLPYWDWSTDSQDWPKSDVFNLEGFGGNGVGPGWCVKDGPYSSFQVPEKADWTVERAATRKRSANGTDLTTADMNCLSRKFSGTTLTSPDDIGTIMMESQTYTKLQTDLELYPHGGTHVGIGGGMGDMQPMSSPFDPIFFMHHNFIEKWWVRWQGLCPRFAVDYTDPLTNEVSPWGTVQSIINSATLPGGVCVTYSNFGALDAVLDSKKATATTNRIDICAIPSPSPSSSPVPADPLWFQDTITDILGVPAGTKLEVPNPQNVFLIKRALENVPVAAYTKPSPSPTCTKTAAAAAAVVPTYVKPAEYKISAPSCEDKSDKQHLRYASKIPNEYFEMMGFTPEQYIKSENHAKSIVDKVNNTPNYTSPSALEYHPSYIADIKQAPWYKADKKKCAKKPHY